MKSATLRNGHISFSRIGFGCANFGGIGSVPKLVGKGDREVDCHRMLNLAFASGITYFDTATTYGAGASERILGNWLKTSGIRRERVVISTKIGGRVPRRPWRKGLSRKHIERELDSSLRRTGLDYIDLLYIHAPDPKTPLEETLGALNAAVQRGKVRKLGASNVDVAYLDRSRHVSQNGSLAEFEVVQNAYNFLDRKDEESLIPFCAANSILYIGYGPLSGGLLTGKYAIDREYPVNSRLQLRPELYRSMLTDRKFAMIERLSALARGLNLSLSVLMYAWLYNRSPINGFLIGARNDSQFSAVTEALRADLTEADWRELEACAGPVAHPACAHATNSRS